MINSLILEELALAWRILGQLGFIDTIFNHISYSEPVNEGICMIMNPKGMFAEEIYGCDLVEIDLNSEYNSDQKSSDRVSRDGFLLHSCVHLLRQTTSVVIHTHSVFSTVVSCNIKGLLPISQTAIEFFDEIDFIDYEGLFRDANICNKIANISKKKSIIFLRNHGVLIVANSIPEAFYLSYYLEEACRIQVATLAQRGCISVPNDDVVFRTGLRLREDRTTAAVDLFAAFSRKFR